MSHSPFGRLLVVDSTPTADLELLRYAEMLGSLACKPEVLIAPPAAGSAVPDLGLLFAIVQYSKCDLIVARHPRHMEPGRGLLHQLLFEAPCAVCLVPEGTRPNLRRPMVRVEPTAKGRELLAIAAALSRAAGTDELVAVHSYFRYGLNYEPESLEKLRSERTLELYRFLARADLSGVNCTPVLEDTPRQSDALLRLVSERDSDLLIIDPDVDRAPVWQWNRREAAGLARSATVPVLTTRLGPRRPAPFFSAMEPIFG
jgi:hypothetical protein